MTEVPASSLRYCTWWKGLLMLLWDAEVIWVRLRHPLAAKIFWVQERAGTGSPWLLKSSQSGGGAPSDHLSRPLRSPRCGGGQLTIPSAVEALPFPCFLKKHVCSLGCVCAVC